MKDNIILKQKIEEDACETEKYSGINHQSFEKVVIRTNELNQVKAENAVLNKYIEEFGAKDNVEVNILNKKIWDHLLEKNDADFRKQNFK